MNQATRTNLLLLRERRRVVINCTGILKGRRQALIKKFLEVGRPLLESREQTRQRYARAIEELQVCVGLESEAYVASLASVSERHMGVRIERRNLLGIIYRDIKESESACRSLHERGYDYASTTPHLDETMNLFEVIVEEMLALARYEGMFRRLAEELLQVTRRIRVLEERVLPGLHQEIRTISQYLAERERESYYRMKLFKAHVRGRLSGV